MNDSIFTWKFTAGNGDSYLGYTVVDTATLANVAVGTTWASPHGQNYGYYTFTGKTDFGFDLSDRYGAVYNEGATVTNVYYDASAQKAYSTHYGGQGIPTTYGGLGTEHDYIAVTNSPGVQAIPATTTYEKFGFGGADLFG